MSIHQPPADGRSMDGERTTVLRWFADGLLRRVLHGIEAGELMVDLPGSGRLAFPGRRPGPHARIAIHHWRCFWRLVAGADVGFAESYMAGEWSSADLCALLSFASRNSAIESSILGVRSPRLLMKLRHFLNRNTRRGSRRNIAAHYDLGNEFYAQWLDQGMTYSSALYSSPGQTLEEAQLFKLDRVIDLLAISGGERVLEIGCGWGSLAERIIQQTACTVTGLTLSTEQLAYAQGRLLARGLRENADLRLQDYRDVRGPFDRIVSIEMLEAVGQAYWPLFFTKLRANLRPGGVAVLQVITIDESCFASYRRKPDFVQKYIFPGGMLPTTGIITQQIAQTGLRLVDTEFFGDSYARTLREWHRRFQKAWPVIQSMGFDMRFKRMWEYYLAYCHAGFDTGLLNVGLYKISHASNS